MPAAAFAPSSAPAAACLGRRHPPTCRRAHPAAPSPDPDPDQTADPAFALEPPGTLRRIRAYSDRAGRRPPPTSEELQARAAASAEDARRESDVVLRGVPETVLAGARRAAEALRAAGETDDDVAQRIARKFDEAIEAAQAPARQADLGSCSACGQQVRKHELQQCSGICQSCYQDRAAEKSIAFLYPEQSGVPFLSEYEQIAQERIAESVPRALARERVTGVFSKTRKKRPKASAKPTDHSSSAPPTPPTHRADALSPPVPPTRRSVALSQPTPPTSASTAQPPPPQSSTTPSRTPSPPSRGMQHPPRPPRPSAHGNIQDDSSGWGRVRASDRSLRTVNPIRDFVQSSNVTPDPTKALVRLDVGDPTRDGNLKVPQEVQRKFCEVVMSSAANGYPLSNGALDARQAVAEVQTNSIGKPYRAADILLFAGASGALEAAIGALANEGDNVLIPCPGFPLFRTIAEGYGVKCVPYDLDDENGWEVFLDSIRQQANSRTAAIIVNNPSNPCGSVYSKRHLESIVAVAEELHLPIIADEIYADMTFGSTEFVSIASVNASVPILVVGGISKKFVVPGWRLGWITIDDPLDVFSPVRVREGLQRLSTRMLLPNSLVQELLPWMLRESQNPSSAVSKGTQKIMKELESNATFLVERFAEIPELACVRPQGAMYLMVKVDCEALGLEDATEFAHRLLQEQSVQVLPGACFQAPNYVRVVFSGDKAKTLNEAMHRIRLFCLGLSSDMNGE